MYILSLPAILSLELTAACNNRCPGCSNVYAAARSQAASMPASTWRTLLDPIMGEAVQIRLTGGEPTLHPDFFEILDWTTSHDAWVTVFTNGRWPAPRELLDHLVDRPHLSGLLISLHGADAPTHEAFSRVPSSFNETMINVALAARAGVPVALSTVITSSSWCQIPKMVALARELGARHVAVNRYIGPPLAGISPSEEQLRAAIESTQALSEGDPPTKFGVGIPQCFMTNSSEGCLAGSAYVSIDPWGNLKPCAHSSTIIGSLHCQTMRDLWHSARMNAWRNLMPGACQMCAAYSRCHGGCRAVQELVSDARDPLRGEPLAEWLETERLCELPSAGRPGLAGRLREETFGYALLGQGQAIPLAPEARIVLDACNGKNTFADLAHRFGEDGLVLLGDLWLSGALYIE